MAKKAPDTTQDQPAPEAAAPADPPQAAQPAQPQEGACEITPQGEDGDLFFARYTWGGAERAHNVRRSSLLRKIAEDHQALETAQGEERQRVEGLLQKHEYLLSRLPAE